MADEVAKRDANHVTVLIGTGNDSDAEVLRLLVDPITKRLLVDSLMEEDGHGTVGDGIKLVTTAGTRLQFASQACKRVFIQANDSNTGEIAIGGVTVVAASGATRRGLTLYSSQGEWFKVTNMNLLYIDSTVNGEGVHFYFEN